MSTYRLKGTAGPVINQAFVINDRLTIGDGSNDDIQLSGPGLQRCAVTVTLEPDGSVMLRTASPGVEVAVNGSAVQEYELGGGDEIRIGQSRFLMQAPGQRPERVLTEAATRTRRPLWPWGLALALLAGGAALAWQQGWFAPFTGS